MSRTYSIKEYHINKLREFRKELTKGMSLKERKALDEAQAARDEWLTWKANCKPLKGKQLRII